MRDDFSIEFITEYNDILELLGNGTLLRIAAVPDVCFAEEAESRSLDHPRRSSKRIGIEEDVRFEKSVRRPRPTARIAWYFLIRTEAGPGFQGKGLLAQLARLERLSFPPTPR